MTGFSRAVFLSYASEDADAARRICESLRAAGIEVWFDHDELRGGDVWDRKIRQQIRDCLLFVPLISASTQTRLEGYFRLEWKIAVDRSHLMAAEKPFLVPVVVDGIAEKDALVPDRFREVQWTRMPQGNPGPSFAQHVARLLAQGEPHAIAHAGAPPSDAPRAQKTAGWRRRGLTAAITVAVLAGVGYWAVDKPGKSAAQPAKTAAAAPSGIPMPTANPDKSIAVLPFADMSGAKNQEYFADGMAEEIIELLATVPKLQVVSRTSSFQFKGQNTDIRTIAGQLDVRYVVEGSVRTSASRLRITVQLIDARDGRNLWSNSYDRDASEVLAVQSEIAQQVARALEVSTGAEPTELVTPIKNPEAYYEYLRAVHAMDRFDADGMQEAVVHLNNALALDPSLTRVIDALAFTEDCLAEWGFVPAKEGFARARELGEKALRRDPNNAMGHYALARVATVYDWDWQTAEHHVREALRIAPHDSTALIVAANVWQVKGRWDEAAQLANAAILSDPFFPVNYMVLGWAQYRAGRLEKAEAAMRRALQISPTYVSGHIYLGKVLLVQHRYAEALREMQQESPEGGRQAGLALAYFALGRKGDSDAMIAEMNRTDEWHFDLAQVHAFRGEKELAMQELEKAYRGKDVELYLIKGERMFDNLVTDPRYKAFLRKLNLPE